MVSPGTGWPGYEPATSARTRRSWFRSTTRKLPIWFDPVFSGELFFLFWKICFKMSMTSGLQNRAGGGDRSGRGRSYISFALRLHAHTHACTHTRMHTRTHAHILSLSLSVSLKQLHYCRPSTRSLMGFRASLDLVGAWLQKLRGRLDLRISRKGEHTQIIIFNAN